LIRKCFPEGNFPRIPSPRTKVGVFTSASDRVSDAGFVLLSVLALLMLVASILTAHMAVSRGNIRTLASLASSYQTDSKIMSVRQRLQSTIGGELVDPSPNGRPMAVNFHGLPFVIEEQGSSFEITIQDEESLPDLHLSTSELLSMFKLPTTEVLLGRKKFQDNYGNSARLPTIEMTLIAFGFSPDEAKDLAPLVSHNRRTGLVYRKNLPERLLEGAVSDFEPKHLSFAGQQKFRIRIRHLKKSP
jgi:hypothetical protein